MRISAVIPTRNAAAEIGALLTAIAKQTLKPSEIVVVDSESSDETVSLANAYPLVRVISIKRDNFNHGGTRDMAFREAVGDVVLFFSQDVVIRDETYIETLVQATLLDGVACACGRQVARADAPLYEKYIREFNYPEKSSLHGADDIAKLGIKAFFLSDVCSAYRRDAYLAVGGFDNPVLTNEDMLIAAKFLHAGYRISYCADAVVFHSHRYSWKQEYDRNYRVGQVLRQYRERFSGAKTSSEGVRLVAYVLRRLLRRGAIGSCFLFCYLCSAKLLGNRRGYHKGTS